MGFTVDIIINSAINSATKLTFNTFLCSVEDTLDSILGGSDDEAEEDAVISQVLDEIGIEVSGKVRDRITV